QKPHPRHDPVAIADAQPALDQVQLEAADVVSCRRVGRAPQKRGEAPAAVDVASLRMAPQLAGGHILDHTLAQRADGAISAHRELLLSEVANTSSSSGRAPHPAISALSTRYPPRQRAPPRSGYRGSDLVLLNQSDGNSPLQSVMYFPQNTPKRSSSGGVKSGVNPGSKSLPNSVDNS